MNDDSLTMLGVHSGAVVLILMLTGMAKSFLLPTSWNRILPLVPMLFAGVYATLFHYFEHTQGYLNPVTLWVNLSLATNGLYRSGKVLFGVERAPEVHT